MTETNMTPTKPGTSLMIGAEVWSPVDGSMVRQASTPSIGDLDQRICHGASHPVSDQIDTAGTSHLPQVIALEGLKLTALIWPIIDRGQTSSVVVLYLDTSDEAPLATELWTGRPGRSELCLSSSSYIKLDRFAKLSPYIAFPNGSGLPGRVWQTNLPQMEGDLTNSPTFMRSTGAQTEGLDIGFAMPCIDGSSLAAVALMLSGKTKSIARVYETWTPSQRGGSLRLSCNEGVYIEAPNTQKASRGLDVPAGDTWIGRAWATRQPEVVCDSSGNSLERSGSQDDQLTSGIAIPIIVLDDVAAVAVLMW
ncbi:MAG: GAF domain-containing protein [Planctomycetota bacterium]